jgi:carbohydrate-selective porin OprB
LCGTPVGIPVNAGNNAYPQSTWGGRVRVALTDTVPVQTGAYEVNPTLGLSMNGLKISTSGDTGAFLPLEIGWRPGHSIAGAPDFSGTLPGDYRLGVYCDTTHGTDPFTNLPDQNMPSVKEQSYTGKQGREMDFALNYGASVYHGINLEPGVRLVLHPGAESEIPHAWVFDLRTSIKF